MALLTAASNCSLFKTTPLSLKEKESSPLSAQILEFCESELFPDTIHENLEAGISTSNYCCYEDHQSFPSPDIINYPHPLYNTDINNFSIIFQEEEDATATHLNHLPLYQFDHNTTIPPYSHPHPNDHVVPMIGPAVCEDDDCCLSSIPPSKFMRLNHPASSCSFKINSSNPLESFHGNLFLGNELDFKGDNGDIFCPDPLPPPHNSNELQQALSNESQHVVNGGGSCATPLTSEITSLEADTFRVNNKLSTEERKEKIHRYMKKRNERNFSKKIKYACRKTLADSRPRVRGRFAKNDEFGENNRTACSNREEDTDEDVKSFHVVVKEEEDNLESSDIFAHISGMNSLKCNYPIQSWI